MIFASSDPAMRKILTILLSLCLLLVAGAGRAQTVKDASYRTIGHADGIPLAWAAYYFFFL